MKTYNSITKKTSIMKVYNLIAVILAAVIFSSCRQNLGTESRFAIWYYYIEAEDATNCQIEYLNEFTIKKDGIFSGEREWVDKYSNHGNPYGEIFLHYDNYTKYEKTDFDFTLYRISGEGKSTVYFVRNLQGHYDDNFPVWVKDNYEYRFVIDDDEKQDVILKW